MRICTWHQSGSSGLLIAALLALPAIMSPVIAGEAGSADSEAQAERVRFFEQRIRPLLVEKCNACHGVEKQKGSLRLDSREAMLKGGESGPAIVPGKPGESLLVEAVNYEGLEMPPSCKLEPDKLEVLTRWVAMGAPWPAAAKTVSTDKSTTATAGAVATTQSQARFSDGDRAFWSFQPLRSDAAARSGACSLSPSEPWSDWSQKPIDRFVLKGLLEKGLTPAPEADRLTLIRRATFDLTGLPPAPEEVDAFLADKLPSAYERLIDRLLASPRYGQRWGRHWLDLVRYAESDGYRQDAFRPDAWRYRDYVVRSLNFDKPYDRFFTEQLAGDELDPADPELRVATGYLRLGTYEFNQRNVRGQWADILNDITDVTGEVFLGVSIGCARCHDHKFDPILQKDYYRLQAFFTPLFPRDDLTLATAAQWTNHQNQLSAWEKASADLRRQLAVIEEPYREKAARGATAKFPDDIKAILSKAESDRTPLEKQLGALAYRQVALEYDRDPAVKGGEKTRRDELIKQLSRLDSLKPATPASVLTATDVGPVAPTTTIPGARKAEFIEPGYLSLLSPAPAKIEPAAASPGSTGRRLALARWLARADNPLSTRVIVNRVWQYHFGKGLVPTSSDFGRLGETPSHPELLDWLTNEFVARGWRLKPLHRLIMTSAVYRQSAQRTESEVETARGLDPDNRLLWKRTVQRLDAEEIRDAMLAVSGELDATIGGPSGESSRPRRSIDTKVIRNSRDPLLDSFDAPDGYNSAGRRTTTTTATQALLLINGPWTQARAAALADRLDRFAPRAGTDPDSRRITAAYKLVYGRVPDGEELSAAKAFLGAQARRVSAAQGESRREPLVDFCHALLNSSEFLYVD